MTINSDISVLHNRGQLATQNQEPEKDPTLVQAQSKVDPKGQLVFNRRVDELQKSIGAQDSPDTAIGVPSAENNTT